MRQLLGWIERFGQPNEIVWSKCQKTLRRNTNTYLFVCIYKMQRMMQWIPMHPTPGMQKNPFPWKNITFFHFHFLAFFVVIFYVCSVPVILFLYKIELYIVCFSSTCFFQQIFTFMSFLHIVYSCSWLI